MLYVLGEVSGKMFNGDPQKLGFVLARDKVMGSGQINEQNHDIKSREHLVHLGDCCRNIFSILVGI